MKPLSFKGCFPLSKVKWRRTLSPLSPMTKLTTLSAAFSQSRASFPLINLCQKHVQRKTFWHNSLLQFLIFLINFTSKASLPPKRQLWSVREGQESGSARPRNSSQLSHSSSKTLTTLSQSMSSGLRPGCQGQQFPGCSKCCKEGRTSRRNRNAGEDRSTHRPS